MVNNTRSNSRAPKLTAPVALPAVWRHNTVASNAELPAERAFETNEQGEIVAHVDAAANMNLEFTGKIWFWRGPAPWYFVTVPADESHAIKAISGIVTYGWGCIPVRVRIGRTDYTTSLFPKDGLYIVPIKTSVRKAERLDVDDTVTVRLQVG